MANRVKLGDWSGTVLKHWRKLTQATVLVLTVVGTFLFTPPPT